MEITFETIKEFVEKRLTWARECPGLAETFKNQAFGAVSYAIEQVWKSNPELEKKLDLAWNEFWWYQFEL